MRRTLRVLFAGDNAEKNALLFYQEIERNQPTFFAFELDKDYKDAVIVDFRQDKLLDQFRIISQALLEMDSWHFVGPKCPNYGGVDAVMHAKERRFMMNFGNPYRGAAWSCADPKCRLVKPYDWNTSFMDRSYFNQAFKIVLAGGKIPQTAMPVHREMDNCRVVPIDEKNRLSKELLNADYATAEYATLFHSLGMKHTIDVKRLCELERPFEASDWVNQGAGAVLLVDADDNMSRARNVITSWVKKNQGTQRYALAIFEVDTQNLNSDIFNSSAVQKAAAEFTKVRKNLATDRRVSDFAKPLIPIDTETTGLHGTGKKFDSLKIEEDGARHLIEAWFKQWPEIQRYFDNQRYTALQKELQESDEALSKSNTELDELRNQVKALSEETVADQPVVKAADAFLRLMAGINMQDHSIQEQRDFNSKFKDLKDELMKLGIGSTPGKKS